MAGLPVKVALGIVVAGDKVLIARRPPGVPLGGYWEFPGGKLEPGESPEAAAVREVFEELGIVVAATGRLPPIEHAYAHATVVLLPVVCRHVSGIPTPLHCSDCRWVLPENLPHYAFPPANAALLDVIGSVALQDRPGNGNLPAAGD